MAICATLGIAWGCRDRNFKSCRPDSMSKTARRIQWWRAVFWFRAVAYADVAGQHARFKQSQDCGLSGEPFVRSRGKVSESLWLTISRPFWVCLLMRCHLLSPDPSTVQFRTMKGSAGRRESAGVLLLREVNILNVPSEPGKEPNREQLTLRCNWKAYHNTSWRQSELPVCAANCERKSPVV